MRTRTEDLLTLRDGEPMDAAERARRSADPETARDVERLERVRRALRELPPLEPPPGVWERIAAECATPVRARRARPRAGFAAAAAAAVALAAVALWLTLAAPDGPGGSAPPAGTVAARPDEGAGRDRDAGPAADRGGTGAAGARRTAPTFAPASYESLLAESARLERMLSQLDERTRPISVGTASTIVGLEDRVALLDEQLTFAAARGAGPEQKQALWRERVDVMNALVHVRYAQSQRIDY